MERKRRRFSEDQKEVSEKIMKYVRGQQVTSHQAENVISIFGRKDGTN